MKTKINIQSILLMGLLITVGISVLFWGIKWKQRDLIPAQTVHVTHSLPTQMILFYSQTCPHCLHVDQFIRQNKIGKQLNLERKEISQDQKNLQLLLNMAKKCHMDFEELGIPFLWTGETCLVGDSDIIDYLRQQMHAKPS